MYDAVIIGAGVVGAVCAEKLSAYELKVCVLEKENDVATGATKANSAIVHAGFDAKPGTLKARLNVRGSEMMEALAERLGVKYKRNGSLVLAFSEEDKKSIQLLLEQGVQNGVKGLRIIDKEELLSLEQGISSNAVSALYAPTGAIICPYELCISAMGNAMDNGAVLKRNFEVTSIKRTDACFEISSAAETIRASYIINAAGAEADTIAKMVGDTSFSIHPRRGEYILLDKECGGLTSHTIFRTPTKKGKGILISPTVDGNLLTGPTADDITDKTDKATTAAGLQKIMAEALEDIEAVPFNRAITSFSGLRAVGSTGDFIISSPLPGFINAAGIESPGLSASPAIAEYIAELLETSGLELLPKKDYCPTRKGCHSFRESSIEEKRRIIEKSPEFGRIICRCEGVSEGEILEAIHRNPGARDIDGIKRRTRSGMGRCQGGFCLPYVAEILARELGIPFEEVTKCGGSSKIVVGKTKNRI